MSVARHREFTWGEGLAISLSMIGVQLSSEVLNQWGFYFYSPSEGVGRTIYVSIKFVWIIFLIGTLWDAVTDPLIGSWSDKTKTRPGFFRYLRMRGRRRPFIFWGSVFMTFTAIGFWFPPVEGSSWANLAFGTVLLCLHWTMFTITVVPLNALGPEIARSEQARIYLGTWVAVGMIVGLAMAAVLPGELIVQLDPARVEDSLTIRLGEGTADTGGADPLERILGVVLPEDLRGQVDLARGGEAPCPLDHPEYGGEVTLERIDGRQGLAFSGDVIGEIDRRHARAAIAGSLPQNLREGFTLLHKGRWMVVPLPAGARDRIAFDRNDARVSVVVSGGMAAEASAVVNGLMELLPEVYRDGLETEDGHDRFTAVLTGKLAEEVQCVRRSGEVSFYLAADLAGALALHHLREACAAALPAMTGAQITVTRTMGCFSATGYRRLAAVMAFVSLLLLQLPVWFIRERYDSEKIEAPPAPMLQAYGDALHNWPFLIYASAFFLFTTGFLAAQRALPYWAELGLGGDESTVTLLMLPFIFTALLSLVVIPFVARRLHVKWMLVIAFFIIGTGLPCMYVIGEAGLSMNAKLGLGAVLFGYCGIGQGIMYVMMTPMMGEIIDYDERRSGERREALYNGLSGFAWKASMGGAILLASLSMHTWGNSLENNTGVLMVGPIAGGFGFLGLVVMLFYPVLSVTRKKPE